MPYPKKRKRSDDHSSAKSKKHIGDKADQEGDAMLRAAAYRVYESGRHAVNASSRAISTAARLQAPQGSTVSLGSSTAPRNAGRHFDAVESNIFGRGSSRRQVKAQEKRPQKTGNRNRNKRMPPPGRSEARNQGHTEIYNEEYIYANLRIPTAQEYGLSVEPIDNCRQIIDDANLMGHKQSRHESPRLTRYTEKCIYTIELDNDVFITATGHGKTKEEAENNAYLHAICILHEQNLFRDILPGGKYTVAKDSLLRVEGDAKKDIIDYAARHDCSPIFEVHHGRSRMKKSIVTVTASIPAISLSGFGRATQEKQAFLQACISLKQAAEAHHETTGDGLILVKDYTKLTTESSQKFIDYYCFQKRTRYDLNSVSKSAKRKQSEWATTIVIQSSEKESEVHNPSSDEPIDSFANQERTFVGIPMGSKKESEETAYLAAGLVLKNEDPAIWKSFVKEMKRGNGEVLKPLRPIDIHVDYDAIEIMRKTVRDVKQLNEKNEFDLQELEAASAMSRKRTQASRQLSQTAILKKSQDLKDALEQYKNNPSLDVLRQKRMELPMVQHREDVMRMINNNDVSVVVGATGSGKTTQLPQLILEEMTEANLGGTCNIICTQPRRIAAISVAQRVAVERNEALQESIGYSVRFDSKMPKFGGSVNYCTTGILLRQLQDSQDATLDGISHIIIDEVHERDIQIDFLLVILRQLMADRKAAGKAPIKIIMMSATIDTTLFCKYFGAGFESGRCPYIEVPGRTFPVTQHFLDEFHPLLKQTYERSAATELYSKDTMNYISRELTHPPDFAASAPVTEQNSAAESEEEDSSKAVINWKSKGVVGEDGEADLAMEKEDTVTPVGLMSVTIAHLLKTTTEGSILVFLPGLAEITALNRILTTTRPLGMDLSKNEDYKIYLLHSAIPQMQQEVFEKLEAGKRKIILSTNIAETSITIPDVIYVVDSSKHRESQYDQVKRMSSLVSTWTSKSNARQRAGRAGRVQHGHYYSMASQARYDSFEVAPQPEILRTDLQELCLQIKSMGIEDISQFLRKAIEPPAVSSVENSIDHLQALGALDEDENLTPLGRLLSTLPVQPSLGKMAILGAIFKCLDPILILAAASTAKDPFLSPLERRAEAERVKAKWADGTGSDHAAVINAFSEWRRLRTQPGQNDKQFAFDNFLHYNTLVSIAQTAEQILEIMQKSGLVEPSQPEKSAKWGRSFRSRYGTEEENENADSLSLQAALATAGFYPNIAVQTTAPRLLRTAHENAAQIHPNSLAAPKSSTGNRYGPIARQDAQPYGTLFTFSQKTQADQNSISLRSISKTSALAVVLFGGKSVAEGAILRVDEWIPFFARGPQLYVTQDFSGLVDRYLATTFARLGAVNQDKLLARGGGRKESILSLDPARDGIVQGVVEALALCAPRRGSVPHARFARAGNGGGANERGGSYRSGGGGGGGHFDRRGQGRRDDRSRGSFEDLFGKK